MTLALINKWTLAKNKTWPWILYIQAQTEIKFQIYRLLISLSDLCAMANEATETFGILVEALSNLQDVSDGDIGVSLPKVYSSSSSSFYTTENK